MISSLNRTGNPPQSSGALAEKPLQLTGPVWWKPFLRNKDSRRLGAGT
jgi:hypothetical protein